MRPQTAVAIVPHYPEREAEIPAIADSSSSMTADEQRLLITDLSSIFDPGSAELDRFPLENAILTKISSKCLIFLPFSLDREFAL
jgi:hypothetical protein